MCGRLRINQSARRYQNIQGGLQIPREKRSGFRLEAHGALLLAPSERLNLPVSILRGITRSHPEHGS